MTEASNSKPDSDTKAGEEYLMSLSTGEMMKIPEEDKVLST